MSAGLKGAITKDLIQELIEDLLEDATDYGCLVADPNFMNYRHSAPVEPGVLEEVASRKLNQSLEKLQNAINALFDS
jgi:hypothetical protein